MQTLAGSDSADDVVFALGKYADDMVKKYPELAQSKEQPAANAEAAKIEADRLRKKTTGATVSSPAAASKVKLPDDPVALFKMYSEQIRKERLGIE